MHIVPYVLPGSLCGWPRTSLHLLEEGHNRPIVRFAYLCHMIGKELVFYIKFFELQVEPQTPTSKLKFVTLDKESTMNTSWREKSFE